MSPRRAVKPTLESTIVRIPKVEKYFVVDNAIFSNERLSWEARGLMGYILSKPDDWQVRLHDLIRRGPAGEHKIRRMLRELQQFGYLRRERMKRFDGTFAWVTTVFEVPGLASEVD
jgi:hypothetical protein